MKGYTKTKEKDTRYFKHAVNTTRTVGKDNSTFQAVTRVPTGDDLK